jgi:hypothetical protein
VSEKWEGWRVLRRCAHWGCNRKKWMQSPRCVAEGHRSIMASLSDEKVQIELGHIYWSAQEFLDVCVVCRLHELRHVGGRCVLRFGGRYKGGSG